MFSESNKTATMKFDAFEASVKAAPDEPRGTGRAGSVPHSSIGHEVTITGDIASAGNIELDGHVVGDVACQQLKIGRRARVEGVVSAEEVIVDGHVEGGMRCARVTLKTNAHVDGEIVYTTLAVEEGAFFVGGSRSSAKPLEADLNAKAADKPKGKGANGKKANGSGDADNTATLALSQDDVIGNG